MSMIASVIGIVILGIRKYFGSKLSPKSYYIIFMVFLIALVLPITVPSKISIYNFFDIENVKYNFFDSSHSILNSLDLLDNSNDNLRTKIGTNNTYLIKFKIQNIIAYLWFGYFILSLIHSMKDYIKNNILIGDEKIEDERMNLILEKCKKRLKIKRKIDLVRQDSVSTPAMMGIFRIKILISEKVLEFDEISLIDAFMHELSHYKRKDNIVNFIIIILKSVYGFNPFIMYMFQEIRNQMEFATDELAISKMNKEEKQNYCKLMLIVASDFSLKPEEVLGLSGGIKYLEKRIGFILDRDKFIEKSKKIFVVTILIVLGILFVLYPTSDGVFSRPKLYLEIDNQIVILSENKTKIYVSKDSEVYITTQNIAPNAIIFYNRLNLETNESKNEIVNMNTHKIYYSEAGNYIYTFNLICGNGKKVEFPVEIVVE